MKDTIRLSFDFPKALYPYLKMMCAKKGIALKDFVSDLLIHEIERYEDQCLNKTAKKRLAEMKNDENINFKEAIKLARWTR